jgi:hypothetical protein
MALGDDLHLARLTPEFREFAALLGHSPKTTDSWAPYALLVQEHGWNRLLRAAKQLHGQPNVFPRDYARLCIQYKQDSEAEEREAKERQVRDAPVVKTPDEDRFAIWLPQYEKTGVYPPWFKRLAERLGRTLP